MALTVETGSGLVDAESYASIADVDAYIAKYYPAFVVDWAALSTSAQETHLRLGTRYIENKYRARWKGYRTTATQALAFPRTGIEDIDGYCVGSNTIPTRLIQATIEAAKRSVEDVDLEADVDANSQAIKSESKRLDVLSKSVEYAGAKATEARYTVIDRLLADYLAAGEGQIPVERG